MCEVGEKKKKAQSGRAPGQQKSCGWRMARAQREGGV